LARWRPNARDKGGCLLGSSADADTTRFGCDTRRTNVDVVAAGRQIQTSIEARCNVRRADSVATKSDRTNGRVSQAKAIAQKRTRTGRGVLDAGGYGEDKLWARIEDRAFKATARPQEAPLPRTKEFFSLTSADGQADGRRLEAEVEEAIKHHSPR
jgi:hypothetical protein